MAKFETIVFYAPTANAVGGGETWVNVMARAFAARGYRVRVIARVAPTSEQQMVWPDGADPVFLQPPPNDARKLSLPQARSRRYMALHQLMGVVKRLTSKLVDACTFGWRPRGFFTNGLSLEACESLVELLSSEDPDTTLVIAVDIHTGSDLAGIIAKEDPKRRQSSLPPFVVQHHNTFTSLSFGERKQFRRIAPLSKGLVALTDEDAAQFGAVAKVRPVWFVNNPSPQVDKNLSRVERPHVVVTMGRLEPQKGIDYAIHAWAGITHLLDWQLHIYGDGSQRNRLEELAVRLGVSDSVCFRGPTADPKTVLANAALHLMPSRFEGWGLVIGEAGAVATPTLAFDSGPGVRQQIVQDVSGVLVKQGSVRGLTKALEELLGNEERRVWLGRGAKTVAEAYSVSNIVNQWEDVFSRIEIEQNSRFTQ